MSFLRKRPRLSYANVASSLALFFALGGGAYAAAVGFVAPSGAVRFCIARNGSASVVKAGRKCRRGTSTVVLNQKGVPGRNGSAGGKGARGPAGPSTGPAGGDLSGSYPNPFIANGKVNTARLAEGAVTTPKLGDSAVSTAKLAEGAVSTARLADGAVTSAKIAGGQVRAANLGPIVEMSNSALVADTKAETVTVVCPAKTAIVSGGFKTPKEVFALLSERSANGWTLQAENKSGAAATITVVAYCLQE